MKIRFLILAVLAAALSACNMTLAADVTPPPNYVPPTPMPTLGPLYATQPLDVENGARIYAEKCAACHGKTGLGDGEQGKALPVKVAPLGLADFANQAKPADWYKAVTRGNIERFMPPFNSLNDQERWDVVGYALSLHIQEKQIAKGKALVQADCADCEAYFSDLEAMSALSGNDLMAIIKSGKDSIPAFGKDFSAEELAAAAAYLRSLTFAAPKAQVEPTPAPEATASPAAESAPAAQETETPVAAAEPAAATGVVRGAVENQTGQPLPEDIKITLRAYDHSGDMSAGPTEVETLEAALRKDGSFVFENVNIPERRIFIAETTINGISYQSEFTLAEAGMTEVVLKPIIVFPSTDDFSVLRLSSLQIFFDYSNESQAQMVALYNISNASGKTVTVDMSANPQEIPFIAAPQGGQPLGFDAAEGSAPFVGTEQGFAMPPSQASYSLVAFYALPREKQIKIRLPLRLAAEEVTVFLPEGVQLEGKAFADEGARSEQGMNLRLYSASNVAKDSNIEFTLSGSPKAAGEQASWAQNNNLFLAVGAFGAALILAGGWLYFRESKKADELEEEEEEEEGDSTEEILDDIIALDDLYRAKKIPEEAYRKRREELKNKLKKIEHRA